MIGNVEDMAMVHGSMELQIVQWERCGKLTKLHLGSPDLAIPGDLVSIISQYIFGIPVEGLEVKVKILLTKLCYELETFPKEYKTEFSCCFDIRLAMPWISYRGLTFHVPFNHFLEFLLCGFSSFMTSRCIQALWMGKNISFDEVADSLSKLRLSMLNAHQHIHQFK